MKELYEIMLASGDSKYIRGCINNTLDILRLKTDFRWKNDAFFGSSLTQGGVELKEYEGAYSLVIYGRCRDSQEVRSLTDAIIDGMAGLEVKTVKILKDQPVSEPEKTSKSTAA